jgi:hypothetical protein
MTRIQRPVAQTERGRGRLRDPEGKSNRLSPEDLGLLARRLAAASIPLETARIKERLTRGFYGI